MKKKISVQIVKLDVHEIQFDLVNSSYAFANALRRILLAEVPTMAIEKVYLHNNTSEMADFALCHRLGLIPIKADPERFKFHKTCQEKDTENNAIKFKLNVHCPRDYNKNMHVYSKHLEWIPLGNQQQVFEQPICASEPDILLMKLAPSQKIEAELICWKGTGKDHAKYSPVAGCFYRHPTEIRYICSLDEENQVLMSENELNSLKVAFPLGYLDFDCLDERGRPKIINRRFNNGDFIFQSCPSLNNWIVFHKNHDILTFTVETIGTLEASNAVIKSVEILKSKCTKFLKFIQKHHSLDL